MAKPKPHARRVARARAFQALYALLFTPVTTRADLHAAFISTPDPTDADMDNAESVQQPSEYAWTLVEGVWSHAAELDALIERFSQHWRVDRLGKVELTVLRLALYELTQQSDVPPRVVLNEALELTASFGDAKAKTFINGILDAAARALAPETP